MTTTFQEMIHRAIEALGQVKANESDVELTKLTLAAARMWINRAEYSMRQNFVLKREDYQEAYRVIFEELLGDYANCPKCGSNTLQLDIIRDGESRVHCNHCGTERP